MTELFVGAIEDVQMAYSRSNLRDTQARHELPAVGIVLARCASNSIEYARLGDCTGVVALGSALVSMGGSRLYNLDEQVIDKMRALKRQGVECQEINTLSRALEIGNSLWPAPG